MTKHIILFLAASPLGTDRLALDEEARAIRVALERSGHRDKFELVTRWAARPLDLLDELRKLKPTVIHFSGHGGSGELRQVAGPCRDIVGEFGGDGGADDSDCQPGLFFQGPTGRSQLVTASALAEALGAAGASVKLVVLNACYSEVLAEALLVHIDYVVGMTGAIHDDAAQNFAVGFYGGLCERQSIAAAYQQGCAAISLDGLPDGDRPQLSARKGIDACKLVLADLDMDQEDGQAATSELAPRQRGWTWYSTVESTEAGVVSVLAIVETIAASAIYAWIVWRFGTLHLAVSACVAPFLLLRTSRSVSLALRWFHWVFKSKFVEQGSSRGARRVLPKGTKAWVLSLGVLGIIGIILIGTGVIMSLSSNWGDDGLLLISILSTCFYCHS